MTDESKEKPRVIASRIQEKTLEQYGIELPSTPLINKTGVSNTDTLIGFWDKFCPKVKGSLPGDSVPGIMKRLRELTNTVRSTGEFQMATLTAIADDISASYRRIYVPRPDLENMDDIVAKARRYKQLREAVFGGSSLDEATSDTPPAVSPDEVRAAKAYLSDQQKNEAVQLAIYAAIYSELEALAKTKGVDLPPVDEKRSRSL